MKSVESGCTKTKTTVILSRFPPSPINMKMSTLSRVVEIGLQACGVWPYLPSTVLYRLLWVVMLGTVQVLQYQYLLIHYHSDNFSDFMDGMSSTMAYTLLFIKLTILWANQRSFSDILQMMSTDWKNCSLTDHSLHITTSRAKLSHRFSHWIIGLQLIAIVLYICGVLAVNADEMRRMNVSARQHILKMKLPFTVNTSPVYALVMILQFFLLVMCACGVSIVNSLVVSLILHIGGQIDILRNWLLRGFSQNVINTVNRITIRALITKHQRIVVFSQNIENLYTYIALMLFVSDTLIICCLGFIIVSSIGTPEGPAILVRSMLFYIMVNLEAFIYCFAGEYLSAKSQMIGDAAYDSLWYNLTSRKNRITLLMILRSQKRLTITIGKIMDLSLERFASVVKASASYVSVLLAIN
ncbi:odorant receptor 24a-like isoform X2 [Harpegnathos saltator]|uniref:odorant receptor 24a-like isoform X2 n=1 Tax=Harpegnathos saltator TaxID=610380 RepID=UPI000DBED96B|nr:odorant receptor 24a-like isoform X2 [Harpegnathos saltator]